MMRVKAKSIRNLIRRLLIVALLSVPYSTGVVDKRRIRRLSQKKKKTTANQTDMQNNRTTTSPSETTSPRSVPTAKPSLSSIAALRLTGMPTTLAPTTLRPTTLRPTSLEPTTLTPTSLEPTTLRPTIAKKQCELAKVPRKSHMECLLATGQCVSSLAECQELGGRYDASGCGGSRASCACCYHLPTFSPTPIPSLSLEPTLPYPEGACQALQVPRFAMMRCLEASGMCVSNARECADLGGQEFQEDGCSVAAKCGCCTHMPTIAPGLLNSNVPTRRPTHNRKQKPIATPRPSISISIGESPSSKQHKENGKNYWKLPTIAPSRIYDAGSLIRRDADASTAGQTTTLIVRLISLILIIAIATQLFPAPTNPFLRVLLLPFTLVYRVLRTIFLFVASCCFSFGDGIAEARAPQPLKPMPIGNGSDLQMTNTSRTGRDANGVIGGLLDDDAEFQAFVKEDDDDDDDGANPHNDDNPEDNDDDIAPEEYGKKRT
mmetsp:Transcript_17797/g.26711  ORF Transcript_17797/g.26711 Transcript_17797/m.26711 type:complete len:491 (-) Transcript_17797:1429-2901(-)